MFANLGPNACSVLIASLPQGIYVGKLERGSPTVPSAQKVVDGPNILLLNDRRNSFVKTLPLLRDHLCPRDPSLSSPPPLTTRNQYLSRLDLVERDHTSSDPGFDGTRWIISEDVNTEHLIDIFTSVVTGSEVIRDGYADFLNHIYWHKSRAVTLGPEIEELADSHPVKTWVFVFTRQHRFPTWKYRGFQTTVSPRDNLPEETQG